MYIIFYHNMKNNTNNSRSDLVKIDYVSLLTICPIVLNKLINMFIRLHKKCNPNDI